MNTDSPRPRKQGTTPDSVDPGDLKTLVQGNNSFACALYRYLRAKGENLFFSPLSISSTLAMCYAGARSATANAMSRTMHFLLRDDRLHNAFGTLLRRLPSLLGEENNRLWIANALWGQRGFAFIQEFLDLLGRAYGSKMEQVDFNKACESARQAINAWAEAKTGGHIKDLIPPGALDQDARLVLTNAIYFYCQWALPFEKDRTLPGPFALEKGRSGNRAVEVPFMHQVGNFPYMETDVFQALQMPYSGGKLAMLILLPREIGTLSLIEDQLDENTLDSWPGRMVEERVEVILPKFTLDYGLDLSKVLIEMGMEEAFTQTADFFGITDDPRGLMISRVIHKATVDVAEEGTEATAATALSFMLGSVEPEPVAIPEFRADHPFVFAIQDTHSKSILFLGRLTDPAD